MYFLNIYAYETSSRISSTLLSVREGFEIFELKFVLQGVNPDFTDVNRFWNRQVRLLNVNKSLEYMKCIISKYKGLVGVSFNWNRDDRKIQSVFYWDDRKMQSMFYYKCIYILKPCCPPHIYLQPKLQHYSQQTRRCRYNVWLMAAKWHFPVQQFPDVSSNPENFCEKMIRDFSSTWAVSMPQYILLVLF